MPQFDVYRNGNPHSEDTYPYLVEVQVGLLDGLQTRVVIPAAKVPALTKAPIERLTPVVSIQSEQFVLLTPQLAGVSRSSLGAFVTNIREYRDEVLSALDMLFTGI